ncbi:O-antigen ligase family protein [Planococcus sp. SIMBA_143]
MLLITAFFVLTLKNIAKNISFRRLDLIFLVFLLVIIYSGVFNSSNILLSLQYALAFSAQLILIVIISFYGIKNTTQLKFYFINFFIITLLLVIVSVFYTFINPSSIVDRGGNIALKGIFHNNNTFSLIILMCILSLHFLKTISSKGNLLVRKKSFFYFPQFFLFVVLVLTSSRSAVVAVLIFYILIFFINSKRWMEYFYMASLVILALIIYKYMGLQELLLKYFRIGDNTTDPLSSRGILLDIVVNSSDSIPLNGLGVGMQGDLWRFINSNNLGGLIDFGFHNSFLQVLIEMGPLGIFIFIFILVSMFFKKRHFILNGSEFLVLKSMILSLSVSGFFESSLILAGSPLSFYYWFLILFALIPEKQTKG